MDGTAVRQKVEHFLSKDTARTVLISVDSFRKSCGSRYVLDKTKRLGLLSIARQATPNPYHTCVLDGRCRSFLLILVFGVQMYEARAGPGGWSVPFGHRRDHSNQYTCSSGTRHTS